MKNGIIMMCCLLSTMTTKANSFETDTFTTKEGKKLEITFIKHASLMFLYDGHVIQVDPISAYADYTKFPKADIILITHEHYDHLDPKAIAAAEKEGTILVSNPSSYQQLQKGRVMKNGDREQLTPYLFLEAVPAYNTTPGRDKFHPRGRDNGYILTLGGTRIYIAGDTEDIPEMQVLKNIDIAFLPVNQPYTMTVPQAVRAAKWIKPRILYPYHYGETPIRELQQQLKDELSIDVRIRQLQ